MNILILDHEEIVRQMLGSRLEALGHLVESYANKEEFLERGINRNFDLVFLDPSPSSNLRSNVLGLRRALEDYAYIFLLSSEVSEEEAMKAGANDIFGKPIDNQDLEAKIGNAQRLVEFTKRVGDDSEDFPSAGGVIAKSAFNQLFLSALERADRYSERTFILRIALSNYKDIFETGGLYAADYAVARLSKYLVLLRRQSDIIGQTGKNEYVLILQRPNYAHEPMEAAGRFAEAIQTQGYKHIVSDEAPDLQISVELIDVPAGSLLVAHHIAPDLQAVEKAKTE